LTSACAESDMLQLRGEDEYINRGKRKCIIGSRNFFVKYYNLKFVVSED